MPFPRKIIPAQRGFSAVQLLVAIAIVAILAALLFPAVKSARAQADAARCLGNLRQLGMAGQAFFNDHNGRLFPSMFWYNPSTHPTDPGMRDYVGISNEFALSDHRSTVFSCPSLLSKFVSTGADRLKRTYSLNFYAHAVNVRKRNDPNPAVRNALQFPGTTHRIAERSKMWMLTDGISVSVPTANFGTYITPDDSGIDHAFFPHNGRQLAVFFDGHAAAMDAALFKKTAPAQERTAYEAFWGTLLKN